MVVKIMVPFGVPIIVRHLLFRYPQRDPNFDNHPKDYDFDVTLEVRSPTQL